MRRVVLPDRVGLSFHGACASVRQALNLLARKLGRRLRESACVRTATNRSTIVSKKSCSAARWRSAPSVWDAGDHCVWATGRFGRPSTRSCQEMRPSNTGDDALAAISSDARAYALSQEWTHPAWRSCAVNTYTSSVLAGVDVEVVAD